MNILITGAAGFIGYHLCARLIQSTQNNVIGLDNLNDYYDVNLKKSRLNELDKIFKDKNKFTFIKGDLINKQKILDLFDLHSPEVVINLAAQAGVRYSIENPNAYVESNILGFTNILETAKKFNVKHFIYASSSSVYGGNTKMPFSENESVDHPISLYAATKKSNELIAHTYSHIYGLPTTGLRFFTVYGPWGRPDMALFLFTKAIIEGRQIEIFNNGNMIRDFTYIDDVVEAIFYCCFKPVTKEENFNYKNPDPSKSFAPHKIFNIGNNNPVKLLDFVSLLEDSLGKKAKKNFIEMQKGDVEVTSSDSSNIRDWINFTPKINIKDGVQKFVNWYVDFYKY